MKMTRLFFLGLALFSILLFSPSAQALEEGKVAPTFTATSTQGEVSLADYAGDKHVVLVLYFAVFTPV